ncbi:FRG domain-containing protein [Petropleomorpha daqingensis]|uniref:FRG domain-containing protein n=1 Tax=Petropleomorpha daqingensis TaxID=2026353 RepID=A0A853CLU6_9ACTN|nr:FRG domain-containing protein [Petropleomorpha daqingensis]NYJ08720.1 hypothetical protein [Petropleomorpha daqingensis]
MSVTSQDQAFRAITRIVTLAAGRRYVWHGCGDSATRIRSSLLRDLIIDEAEPLPTELELRRHETAILREAREWGLGVGASDLALLAELHQSGVPTRLLDVTDNPVTALWFACERDDEAGVLFAFDVTESPTYGTAEPSAAPEWSLRHALAVSAKTGAPFLVRPARRSERMQAQEGLFLSGAVPVGAAPAGADGLPLPFSDPPGKERLANLFSPAERAAGRPTRLPFCAIVIPGRMKKKLRDHLVALHRRRSTVYPDAAGFRDALRDGEVALHPLPEAVSAYDDVDAVGDLRPAR